MKFNLTTTILYHWFNEYNDKYFDNELALPTFQIKQTKSYLGKAFCLKNLIIISNYLDRTEKEFQNTFIHEMIHLWQWDNFHNVNHGYTFKKKAAEINRDGWQIQRCSATNGAMPSMVKKDKIYIANFNYLNRDCYCKLNSSSYDRMYEKFTRCKGVTNVKVYKCNNSVVLDKYPSLTNATRYWWGENAEIDFKPAITTGTEIAFLSAKRK